MKKNVGDLDAAIRILIGLPLLFAAAADYGTPWTWLGAIPLATALLGFCPLYPLVGMNTCSKKKA